MQHRRRAIHAAQALSCAIAFAATAAGAQQDEAVRAAVPQARLVGEAPMRWFGLPIYDARLFAPAGFDALELARHAFVLELTYRRALRGRDIARRSIEEMRRAPSFPEDRAGRWESELAAVLPDVQPGDRIAGVHTPGGGAAFIVNGRRAGEIADAQFARLFFGIWLAPHTSEPGLRAALLGSAQR
ncbi:chalcone isomerase family protein [Ramlibacter albus]|uniref:Chalcone isomerase family protein n=1 Tax=Ramlibacter albus TaxID=2079448 RepID=A0A923M768_9BURK|nr:chalcone isomerase family protein [Ramlibacter albus]MBC5765240.1 chalcone isomerase family protein [Ramlibacter albus]